jgi:hypothetical protein
VIELAGRDVPSQHSRGGFSDDGRLRRAAQRRRLTQRCQELSLITELVRRRRRREPVVEGASQEVRKLRRQVRAFLNRDAVRKYLEISVQHSPRLIAVVTT